MHNPSAAAPAVVLDIASDNDPWTHLEAQFKSGQQPPGITHPTVVPSSSSSMHPLGMTPQSAQQSAQQQQQMAWMYRTMVKQQQAQQAQQQAQQQQLMNDQQPSPGVPQMHNPSTVAPGVVLGPGGGSTVPNLSANFIAHAARPLQVDEILDRANRGMFPPEVAAQLRMLTKYGQQRGHPPQQQQPQQMQLPQPPSTTMSHTQLRNSPSLSRQYQQQGAANMGVLHLPSASALGQQQQQLAQVRQQQLGQSSIPDQQQQQQPSSSSLQQQHSSQYSSLQPPAIPSDPENSLIRVPAQDFGSQASSAKHLAGCSPEMLFQYAEQFHKQKMEQETKIQSLLPLRPETRAELEQCVKAREHISSLEAIVSQIQMRRASLSGRPQNNQSNGGWPTQAPPAANNAAIGQTQGLPQRFPTPQHAAQQPQQQQQRTPPQQAGPPPPNVPPSGGGSLNAVNLIAPAQFFMMLKSWFDTRSVGLRDIPKLNNRPVDLHVLFCETVAYGGNEKVTKNDAWGIIGGRMGLAQLPVTPGEPPKASPEVARLLAHTYQRLLALFEVAFLKAQREQQARAQRTQQQIGYDGMAQQQQLQQHQQQQQQQLAQVQQQQQAQAQQAQAQQQQAQQQQAQAQAQAQAQQAHAQQQAQHQQQQLEAQDGALQAQQQQHSVRHQYPASQPQPFQPVKVIPVHLMPPDIQNVIHFLPMSRERLVSSGNMTPEQAQRFVERDRAAIVAELQRLTFHYNQQLALQHQAQQGQHAQKAQALAAESSGLNPTTSPAENGKNWRDLNAFYAWEEESDTGDSDIEDDKEEYEDSAWSHPLYRDWCSCLTQ